MRTHGIEIIVRLEGDCLVVVLADDARPYDAWPAPEPEDGRHCSRRPCPQARAGYSSRGRWWRVCVTGVRTDATWSHLPNSEAWAAAIAYRRAALRRRAGYQESELSPGPVGMGCQRRCARSGSTPLGGIGESLHGVRRHRPGAIADMAQLGLQRRRGRRTAGAVRATGGTRSGLGE